MRQDELDRRLVAALTRDGLLDDAKIAAATARASAAKTPLGRALLSEEVASASAIRAVMRSVHAGFDCRDEAALERHLDRLVARSALRAGDLEKSAWKAAIKLDGERRAKGVRGGLGSLLVASGALAAAKAASLEKAFEKRFVVCGECFARVLRRAKVGAPLTKECTQCGAVLVAREKQSWLRPEEPTKEAPAPVVLEQEKVVEPEKAVEPEKPAPPAASADTTPPAPVSPAVVSPEVAAPAVASPPAVVSPEVASPAVVIADTAAPTVPSPAAAAIADPAPATPAVIADPAPAATPVAVIAETPATTPAPVTPEPRRRPKTAPVVAVAPPAPRASSRAGVALLAALAGAGLVLGVQAGVRSDAANHWESFRGSVADARREKSSGRIAEAATRYAAALASVEGNLPQDAKDLDLVVLARAERSACDRFAACTKEATPARFAALARSCGDEDVLLAACDAASGTTDPLALVVLATRDETAVAHRAVLVASKLTPAAASPVLVAAIDAGDEALAREAASAALAFDDVAAAPAVERVVARFPRDEAFAKKASGETTRWKDRAAIPALRRLARVEWAPIAESAIVALAALKPRDAIPELVLGLEGSAAIQTQAITALMSMGDEAVPALGAALTKGQPAAARALLKIATPAAFDMIATTLPKLGWPGRQLVLETVLHEKQPPAALSDAVEKLLGEVVIAHKKHDGKLARSALALFERAARTYEIADAADYLTSEAFFTDNEANATKLDRTNFGIQILRRTNGRLELKNYTDRPTILYARGPTPVAVAVPAGETGGAYVDPGEYLVGIAYVVDGKEAYPSVGSIEVPAGKLLYVQYGEPPADAEPAEGIAPTANDEERRAKLKRALGRAFRRDQLIEEKKKALANMAEGPFANDKLTAVTTKHYSIATDAVGAIASELALEIEAAYVEYTKYVPATKEERFVVRFFETEEGFDAWREKTTLSAVVIAALLEERDLVKRTHTVADKGRNVDPALAKKLDDLAKGFETIAGRGEIGLEEIDAFDDQIAYLEGMKDVTAKALALALAKVKAERIIADGKGTSQHGILLGYFNHENKELCIWQSSEWLDTVRHEAFHQFLDARAANAPLWLHEGLATYFEVYPKSGRNQSRIEELRRASQAKTGYLDALSLDDMFGARQFDSLDYAVAWSFIYYLVDKDPGALGKILTRARDGEATPFGIASVFADYEETQKSWHLYMKALVRTR